MPKLICQLLGKHRPALVVTGFANDGSPRAEPVCPNCRRAHHRTVAF